MKSSRLASASRERSRQAASSRELLASPAFDTPPQQILESSAGSPESSIDRQLYEPPESIRQASHLARLLKFLIRVCLRIPSEIPTILRGKSRDFYDPRERQRFINTQRSKRAEIKLYGGKF